MADKPREASVLTNLSFALLSDDLKARVRNCAQNCSSEKPLVDKKHLLLNRLDLKEARARANNFLDEVDATTFRFMNDSEASYYEDELSFVFYLALADCELGILDKKSDLKEKYEHLLHIGGLLAQLRNRNKRDTTPVHDKDDPTRYLGLRLIAPDIIAALEKLTLDSSASAIEYPASLNDGRLYVVWAAEMVQHIADLLKKNMPYISLGLAESILEDTGFVTGSMGWILYFLRGGVNTAFLFEVSSQIKSLNLSKEEQHECFIGQWHEKKFSILNDAVWGLVNCICFFILTGPGIMGYYGDALNGALFIFDFALGAWALAEAQCQHEKVQAQYKRDIDVLEARIKRIKALEDGSEAARNALTRAEMRLRDLKREARTSKRDWDYEITQLKLDAAYSGIIILSFAVLCCFFVPPGTVVPATMMIYNLVGSIMCFGFGVVHAALTSTLGLLKSGEVSVALEEDYGVYLKRFREEYEKGAGIRDENKLHLLFLDLRRTMAKTEYQVALADYQLANMICTIMTDILIPVMFIAAFVLMPTTIGLQGFLLGALALAIANCYVAELAPEDVRDADIQLTLLTKFSGFFKSFFVSEPPKAEVEPEKKYMPPPFPDAVYTAFCNEVEQGAKDAELKATLMQALSPEAVEAEKHDTFDAKFAPDTE